MPSKTVDDYVKSGTNFYELLGITFESSQKDLDSQWRKTARKYHPDKVGSDPVAQERLHLVRIGYELLSNPTDKAEYDRKWNAKLLKERENELFRGQRRQMKDELEAREKGVKRTREEDPNDEEILDRIAEDGKRRIREREEAKRQARAADAQQHARSRSPPAGSGNQSSEVTETDRRVTVKWALDGQGESINEDRIESLFSRFGKVKSVDILKAKKLRLSGSSRKRPAAVGMVEYVSVVGAHAAVEDFEKQCGDEWDLLDSVNWAAGKEPAFLNMSQPIPSSSPSTPLRSDSFTRHPAFANQTERLSTPAASANTSGNGLRNKPSFSSFTPKSSLFDKSSGVGSPNLEEMIMIGLKNAEKKRLAEEIQRQDDAAKAGQV
ncbi:MAG: hypothetical protein LQ351_003267 [Letrouitia transgressa]|nr:MAG: hypothetical protein LQ351_003267 [Letrouitia transgressa]